MLLTFSLFCTAQCTIPSVRYLLYKGFPTEELWESRALMVLFEINLPGISSY